MKFPVQLTSTSTKQNKTHKKIKIKKTHLKLAQRIQDMNPSFSQPLHGNQGQDHAHAFEMYKHYPHYNPLFPLPIFAICLLIETVP